MRTPAVLTEARASLRASESYPLAAPGREVGQPRSQDPSPWGLCIGSFSCLTTRALVIAAVLRPRPLRAPHRPSLPLLVTRGAGGPGSHHRQ